MRMNSYLSRREFLGSAAAVCATSLATDSVAGIVTEASPAATGLDFPLLDLHVHLDNSTIDNVVELSRERGVKFGIVEHAGTKENKYPIVLSNDEELKGYVRMLDGKPVFKGLQAEWKDWMTCFSREALAQLDFVLGDAMTFPGKDGQRVKLWEPDIEARLDLADRQKWMDRYVDWHVEIMATQPIDIFGNTSWLPKPLAGEYDLFWTPARIQKVVDAAVKYRVALEISSSYSVPSAGFLKLAKAAGVKFSFGSNGRYPKMGRLDYCLAMAKELGLKRADLFTPSPDGPKASRRRQF